ncbi:MAG: heme exporter protein CcmD [Alphaproteobacteria bacterium]
MYKIWHWLQMEGYGIYVWGAYGFAISALIFLARHLRVSARKAKEIYARLTEGDALDSSTEKFR